MISNLSIAAEQALRHLRTGKCKIWVRTRAVMVCDKPDPLPGDKHPVIAYHVTPKVFAELRRKELIVLEVPDSPGAKTGRYGAAPQRP